MIVKNKRALLIVVIALFQLLSFLMYGQSLKYAFVGDDYYLIFHSLQGKSDFCKMWFNRFSNTMHYRPVAHLTYRINFLLAGPNPFSYHFINIVLHGLNCALVFVLAYFLLKGSIFMSLCPALFFMVNPIHSIAVNWIAARYELLCCFFILLSLINYCRFLTLLPRRSVYYAFSLLACFAAFGSKEHAFTLPVLILICDIWRLPAEPVKNRIKRVLPFFIILGAFLILRYSVLRESFWGAYAGKYSFFDYGHIFENILRALKLIVFPVQAILRHTSYVYFSFSFLVFMSILPVLFKDQKVIFSLLWFFITFGSLYNFGPFPSYNLYIQSIGLCLFMPFTVEFYAKLFFRKGKALRRLSLISVIFILLSMYCTLTVKRNTYARMASIAADKFVKGVLKIYPRYPAGSTFYFINAPYLLADNQIYSASGFVVPALSFNYGLYHKEIPAYVFTFMLLDTLKAENEIEVEVKDNKTLIVSSKDVCLKYRDDDAGTEYAFAEEIDCFDRAVRKDFITAKKIKIILKEKTIKNFNKRFFYFSNGVIYELKNWGQSNGNTI